MLTLALELHPDHDDLASAGPHATGNKFATEKALVANLSRALIRALPQESVEVLSEFETSNGIADLVIARLRRDWRLSMLHRMSPSWAYTFRCLPYRVAFSTESAASLAGVSIATARAALKNFCGAGLCEASSTKSHWVKLTQPRPIANEIISIEAKLRDWRRALYQANRYRAYSNESWVVLDAACSGPAVRNLDAFSARNIGLAIVSRTSGLNILYQPKKECGLDPIAVWHANVEIDRRLSR